MSPPNWFQTVEGNLSAGRALLDGVTLENSQLLEDGLAGVSALSIGGAVVTPTTGGFEAKGLSDVLSLGASEAALVLTCDDSDWTGVFSIDVPLAPMSLPFAKKAVVEKLTAELRFGGTDTFVTGAYPAFGGRINIDGHVSDIELSPTSPSGGWRLELRERFDLASAGAVLEAMGAGGAIDDALSKQFLGTASIGNVALGLRPDTFAPDDVQFDVNVPSMTVPVPGVTLQDFCFAFAAAGVASPEQRTISASVSGRIGIGSAVVDVYGQVPDLVFQGALTGPTKVDFGALYKTLGGTPPTALPAFTISDLNVVLRLREQSARVSSRVDGHWPILGTSASLEEIAFDLALSAAGPEVSVYATTIVAGTEVRVGGRFGSELELEGAFPPTSLSALLSRLGVEKPPEIPDVQFGPMAVAVSGSAIHLSGSASADFDLFATGQTPLPRTDVALSMDLAKGAGPAIAITLSTTARLTIEDDVTIDGLSVTFVLGADYSWSASGTVATRFMDTRLDLAAAYHSSQAGSEFTLATRATKASIALAAATLGLRSFTIGMTRGPAGSNPQLTVTADASFEVKNLLQLDGTLTVSSGTGLSFSPRTPDGGRLTLHLPAVSPQHTTPRVELRFSEVRIARAACTVAASVSLLDVPPPADTLFGSTSTTGTLTVDAAGVALAIVPPAGASIALTFARGTAWEVHLPAIRLEKVSLGRHTASAEGAAQWQLGATLGVDGLDQLNTLCGGANVFRHSVDLVVALGESFSVTPTTSPFNAIELRTKDDGTVWTVFEDFFGAGLLSFRVPELSFDFEKGRWRAAGGVESQGQLRIPLRPIKWLAEKCGFGSAALQPMPDAIPLVDLDLKSPAFYDHVAGLLGHIDPAHLDTFNAVATELAKDIERLPDQLGEYLVLHIPTNFVFDLAIEPTGGASFGLRVEDGKPLRALTPFVAPLPGLLGVTVSGVSFGLTAGGQIGVLGYDGCVDVFDGVDLLYALLTGKGSDIGSRIVMRKLQALVPIAVPVPIPLFYDQIGWEYKNLLGLALQMHASFPDPQPSLSDWVKLLADLGHFVTDEGFLLHAPGHLPQAMQLDFHLQPTFLALPEYLGGAVLGSRTALPTFHVSQTLARALDSLKTGSIGDLIQAVPLKYESGGATHWIRVGHEDVRFGPLHLQAAWCVTTEEEFRTQVLRDDAARQALAAANSDSMIECTPARLGGKSYDKGFLVLLMGEVGAGTALTDIVAFRAQFGMAVLGPRDFQTAVRVVGTLGPQDVLSLAIEGVIDVHPDSSHADTIAVVVAGSTTLTVFGQRFTSASRVTVVPGVSLSGQVTFSLNHQLALQGMLTIDARGVLIDGSIDWSGIAGQRFHVGSRAAFSKDGATFQPIAVTVGPFTAKATLKLPGAARGDLFSMRVAIDFDGALFDALKAGLVTVADELVTKEVSDGYDNVLKAIAAQESFEPSLRGIQQLMPGVCTAVIAEIKRAVSKERVYAVMDAWAAHGSVVERAAKAAAVAAAKLTGPEAIAQQAAKPWIDKMTSIRNAAAAKIEDTKEYRARLQAALRQLKTPDTIEIRIGAIGHFPGVAVYQQPVLAPDQLKMLDAFIGAVGSLQKACDARFAAEQVLGAMPDKQRLLAQVRQNVKNGIDAEVPVVTSLSFDASAGLSTLASVDLTATIAYAGVTSTYHLRAGLSNPSELPAAIARAFAAAS